MDNQKLFSPVIAKVFLAVMIFVAIFIGGYRITHQQKTPSGETIQSANQETESYYNLLEKKCAGSSCCLSSLKIMRANNYEEADKDGKCPNRFKADELRCESSLSWCEPIEKDCAKAGEIINHPAGYSKNLPDKCCEGLEELSAYRIENGECEVLIGGPFSTCMPCGNGICESINNFKENKCNCPEDCGEETDTSD